MCYAQLNSWEKADETCFLAAFLASAVGKSVASFCIAALVFVAAVVAVAVAVAVAVEEAFGRLSAVSVAEGVVVFAVEAVLLDLAYFEDCFAVYCEQ